MSRLFSLLLTAAIGLSLPSIATAQSDVDKIGTVDMNQLISSFYKTKALQKQFASYGEEVGAQRDERIAAVKKVVTEFEELTRRGQESTISNEDRSKVIGQAAAKQREARSLQQDLQAWLRRRQAALNERVSMEMTDVRKEVIEEVNALGKEEGYDFIFDRTGGSAVGVAVLVYTKDATDLTGVLLERINKDEPK